MARTSRILVVDDDPGILQFCQAALEASGHETLAAQDGDAALEIVRREQLDVMITDLQMPGMNGFQIMREAAQLAPDLPCIMITGLATVENAVEAMKHGAYDFIQKPINFDHMTLTVRKALERKRLIEQNQQLRQDLDDRLSFSGIVGGSREMHAIYALIEKAAPTNASVLIHGESGTGKELIARAIHGNSARKDETFVAVDCVALPTQLLESELFGHEKGAFTGAETQRIGLLEMAQGSSVFLDEITELDIDLQAKLLRVLQERQFRRIGGRRLIDLDIRIIAATKRNPEEAVAGERLREDLYYRLNVIPVHLPPLRQRRGDVPLLIRHFADEFGKQLGAPPLFSADVVECLQNYQWPGNIRELRNMIERLCILSSGSKIEVRDLPSSLRRPAAAAPATEWLADLSFKEAKTRVVDRFEVTYLEQIMDQHDGNISKAAEHSGVDRKTLHRLINKHGLTF